MYFISGKLLTEFWVHYRQKPISLLTSVVEGCSRIPVKVSQIKAFAHQGHVLRPRQCSGSVLSESGQQANCRRHALHDADDSQCCRGKGGPGAPGVLLWDAVASTAEVTGDMRAETCRKSGASPVFSLGGERAEQQEQQVHRLRGT